MNVFQIINSETKSVLVNCKDSKELEFAALHLLAERRSENKPTGNLLYVEGYGLSDETLSKIGENPIEVEAREGEYLRVFPVDQKNPHGKDPSLIPKGFYCYHGTRPRQEGEPEFTEDGRHILYLNYCPYFTTKEFNGVRVPWCAYLELGGIDSELHNGISEADAEREKQKLLEHFVTEEEMDKKLPLFLLFDSCKSCSVNEHDEDIEFVK